MDATLEHEPLQLAEADDVTNAEASNGEGDQLQAAPYRILGTGVTLPTPNAVPKFTYYHLDHLGTPRVILDNAGNLVSKHHYMPYGEEMPFVAQGSTSKRQFTGHERDPESGLDYMLARYYGSSLGRFQSPDPGKDTELEDPQSWNKYSYVRNNPILFTDPDGQKKIKVDKADKKFYKAVKKQLKQLKKDPRIKKALNTIKKSKTEHTIRPHDAEKRNKTQVDNKQAAGDGTGTGSTTYYDPEVNVVNDGQQGPPGASIQNLAHEVSHIEDAATGTRDLCPNGEVAVNETKAVRMENSLASAFGWADRRATYQGKPVDAPGADPEDPGE
jgi:RHS repeat-associated protein